MTAAPATAPATPTHYEVLYALHSEGRPWYAVFACGGAYPVQCGAAHPDASDRFKLAEWLAAQAGVPCYGYAVQPPAGSPDLSE